jgi:hypothetical protein
MQFPVMKQLWIYFVARLPWRIELYVKRKKHKIVKKI